MVREDWDFSRCPKGSELDCWLYEYARESQSVIRNFRECVEHPQKNPLHPSPSGRDVTFDEDGYWHHRIDKFDSEGEFEDQLYLELAPGFPDTPYLKTKRRPVSKEFVDVDAFVPPGIRDADSIRDAEPRPAPRYFANIYIRWEYPDKKLIRDFAKWLKVHRPFPARSRRGKSAARVNMSELKALGAYRLLKTMTAPEALAYTEKYIRGGLFAKIPDWYEARQRAKRLLNYWFS